MNGTQNVGALLKGLDAQYAPGLCRSITFVNNNAGIAYLHFTEKGNANPGTPTGGLPISNAAASAPSMTYTAEDVDTNTTYIHTTGAINIQFAVVGR